MRKLKTATAAVLLSTIASTQAFAQWFSEPAAFQAQHPDRDVLNGGALTPAARMSAATGGYGSAYGALGGGYVSGPPVRAAPRVRHQPRRR